MGCAFGKTDEEFQKLAQMIKELIESYDSFEKYIQAQREAVFQVLQGDQPALETQEERINFISIDEDLKLFKRYKKANKYKHEINVQKFLKNIQYCIYKLKNVFDQHSACLAQLQNCRETHKGAKYITKNTQTLEKITNSVLAIGKYLEIHSDIPNGLALETSECLSRNEIALSPTKKNYSDPTSSDVQSNTNI